MGCRGGGGAARRGAPAWPAVRFHVLHDRLLNPGKSKANLDHVVVSPGGIYLIDAKLWAGTVTVHDGNVWQHTSTGPGHQAHKPKHDELDKIAGMAKTMADRLGRPVHPVLALANKRARGFTGIQVRGVYVMTADTLTAWLTTNHPTRIPASDVAQVTHQVARTFPPATGDANTGTLRTRTSPAAQATHSLPGMPARLTRPWWTRTGYTIPALTLAALLTWTLVAEAATDDRAPAPIPSSITKTPVTR